MINKPGVGFHNYNTFANSSALDRTIMSADSFLAGVFPNAAQPGSKVSSDSQHSLQVRPPFPSLCCMPSLHAYPMHALLMSEWLITPALRLPP